jgi:anti-sigma factor RsiW
MRSEHEVERLFLGAVDGGLDEVELAGLRASLGEDPELRARFEAYQGAVQRLRSTPRARAPAALAAMVLRRSRRRRFQLRRDDGGAAFRVPAEVLLPILLGALVALFVVLGMS